MSIESSLIPCTEPVSDESASPLDVLGSSQDGKAWLNAGLTHMAERRTAQAVAALRCAVSLLGPEPDTMVALGWAQLMAGDAVAANAMFGQAMGVAPDNAEAHGGLAASLIQQGLRDRANAEMQTAFALDPASVSARVALSLMLDSDSQPNRSVADVFSRMLARPFKLERELH